MHVGPYSEEPRTLAQMDAYMAEHGYRFRGRHHEIYLGNPQRAKPEKLKTVLRHPVEKAENHIRGTPSPPARRAWVAFFADRHAGRYAQAAEAYAGTYEIMIDHNPSVDPADHAALFRNACTINGAQCLEVRSAALMASTAAQAFRFEVEFQLEDGSIFWRGPCG